MGRGGGFNVTMDKRAPNSYSPVGEGVSNRLPTYQLLFKALFPYISDVTPMEERLCKDNSINFLQGTVPYGLATITPEY